MADYTRALTDADQAEFAAIMGQPFGQACTCKVAHNQFGTCGCCIELQEKVRANLGKSVVADKTARKKRRRRA